MESWTSTAEEHLRQLLSQAIAENKRLRREVQALKKLVARHASITATVPQAVVLRKVSR
jgi:cell division septum initiation protein DivIVA